MLCCVELLRGHNDLEDHGHLRVELRGDVVRAQGVHLRDGEHLLVQRLARLPLDRLGDVLLRQAAEDHLILARLLLHRELTQGAQRGGEGRRLSLDRRGRRGVLLVLLLNLTIRV